MKNKFKGIIFYSKKVKDNDLYIKILSSNDEINSGLVYGGNSSKKKSIYQNGYFVDYTINQKSKNAPPVLNAEISTPFLGNLINDKYKLSAILSILSLIKISIVEGQNIKGYYIAIENLIINIVNNNRWINFYCEWLFNLLKLIGYQIDYKNNYEKKYYDLVNQVFLYHSDINTIQFPHNFFLNNQNLTFNNINSIFIIFESIFSKNHLDNTYHKMPLNFLHFKKIILNRLKSK